MRSGLLELAKSAASQRISQELLERTYSQAKRLIEEEDYESAVQLLAAHFDRSMSRFCTGKWKRRGRSNRPQNRERTVHWNARRTWRHGVVCRSGAPLEEQSDGVKRLPRVDQALVRARKLQEAEANFSLLTGRCYAQIGNAQGIADLKQLRHGGDSRYAEFTGSGEKAVAQALRADIRGESHLHHSRGQRISLQDDSSGAEAILRETTPWREFAPAQAQDDLRTLETEVAAAKKVLRFRRGSWR